MRALLTIAACVILAGFLAGELHGAPKKKSSSSKSKSSSTSSGKKAGSSASKKKAATPTPKPKPKATPAATPKPPSTPAPAASSEPALPKKDAPTPAPATPAPAAPGAATTPAPATPAPAAGAAVEQPRTKYAPSASIAPTELLGFDEQPPRVQKLIEGALALAKLNLTYTMGSDDPAKGGMDCSGAVSHLLRQHGFKDVPRDAAGQYVWARKHGQFFAVISKKAGGFEFAELLPGDLMFWSGTYNAEKDPPVTHSMIYLGVQRKRGQHVMWGSSDGRSYDGKPRYGVSVFDFKMPRTDPNSPAKSDFLGYARIPGLRTE